MPASVIVGRDEAKAMATKQKTSRAITKRLAYLLLKQTLRLFLHVTCTSNDIIVQLWLCFNDSSGCALV